MTALYDDSLSYNSHWFTYNGAIASTSIEDEGTLDGSGSATSGLEGAASASGVVDGTATATGTLEKAR